ncbi:MAG: hypothetical protein HYV23_05620 [Deltaproteobacteria bacterium]|nr:hypothetical protein [Deltaproteobacteria bacterium]
MLPSWASAEDAPPEAQAREVEAISYRVKSSATVLEAPSDTLKLKEIVTRQGKGLWAVHEAAPEEAPHDCGEVQWPDAVDYIQER